MFKRYGKLHRFLLKLKFYFRIGVWIDEENLNSLIKGGYGSGVPVLNPRKIAWYKFRFYCKHGLWPKSYWFLLEFIVAYYPRYRYLDYLLKGGICQPIDSKTFHHV